MACSRTSLLLVASLVWTLTGSGCALITAAETIERSESGPPSQVADWRAQRVAITRFQRNFVAGQATSTAYVGGAMGYAESKETRLSFVAPQFATRGLENLGWFKSVSPGPSDKATLHLELSMACTWNTPWWTWVQLLDLWVHAWFFPTLGVQSVITIEMSLYTADRDLLHRWSFKRVGTHLTWIWWLMGQGGLTNLEKHALPESKQQEAFDAFIDEVRRGGASAP